MFKKKDKPPKDTKSPQYRRWMAEKIKGRQVRYALERNEKGVQYVIGKSGFITVADGLLSVICGERTLFTAHVDQLEAWEFLSLEGVVLTAFDLVEGKERTVLAYYKYYRD